MAEQTVYIENKLHRNVKVIVANSSTTRDVTLPVGCIGIMYVYEKTRLPKLLDENTSFIEATIDE
jgi:hypothetical protein